MLITLFFLIGVFLLKAFSPDQLALVWETFGTPRFFLNLITHMFSHANWAHLMGNYMFVFPYALYLEHKIGQRKFLYAWIACGLTAVGLQALASHTGGVIGSSGAAFGIASAALWMANENQFIKYVCRIVAGYHLLTQALLTYLALTNPLFALFSGVAFAAHLGGILCGIFLATVELRRRRRSASQ